MGHDIDGIERGAPFFRGGCRMRALSTETELGGDARHIARVPRRVAVTRVPVQNSVDIVEKTGSHHEDFGTATFLGRSAIEPYRPRQLTQPNPVGDGDCGGRRCDSKEMMATTMSPTRFFPRFLGRKRLLAKPRQGIELSEHSDDGSAAAVLRDEGRRNPCHVAFDFELGSLEEPDEALRGALLLIPRLGPMPDIQRRLPVAFRLLIDRSNQRRLAVLIAGKHPKRR